jgi:hypothetical protein
MLPGKHRDGSPVLAWSTFAGLSRAPVPESELFKSRISFIGGDYQRARLRGSLAEEYFRALSSRDSRAEACWASISEWGETFRVRLWMEERRNLHLKAYLRG